MTSNRISPGCADRVTTQPTVSAAFGNPMCMEKTVYDRRAWRNLPREFCTVEHLFGEVVGQCAGLIQLHHVDDNNPDSRAVPVCARHHPSLQAALRHLRSPEKAWKMCPHRPGTHRYPGAKEECERRLNLTSDAA